MSRSRSRGGQEDKIRRLREEIEDFCSLHKLDERASRIMTNMHPVDIKKVIGTPFPTDCRNATAFVVSSIRKVEQEAGGRRATAGTGGLGVSRSRGGRRRAAPAAAAPAAATPAATTPAAAVTAAAAAAGTEETRTRLAATAAAAAATATTIAAEAPAPGLGGAQGITAVEEVVARGGEEEGEENEGAREEEEGEGEKGRRGPEAPQARALREQPVRRGPGGAPVRAR
eukprot:CAMPEP_0175367716 /NCGR_PEP_ID=MMETSP0095-20121207/19806_1 /TAXON_ID=311494 /ORGANISM="Alexandrium monilatum, Strain CCMP3105" /LENGTH=227 /DNA_ID=CAMNT_0016665783 /DNA_START=86 /DNA_END=767 /DNA_ORIENTATION=-